MATFAPPPKLHSPRPARRAEFAFSVLLAEQWASTSPWKRKPDRRANTSFGRLALPTNDGTSFQMFQELGTLLYPTPVSNRSRSADGNVQSMRSEMSSEMTIVIVVSSAI